MKDTKTLQVPPRLPLEKKDLENALQLLYLIHKLEKFKGYTGVTKIQKLCFLIEFEQKIRGIDGFSFNWFRWEFGPMSKEIYNLLKILKENEIVTQGYRGIILTQKGIKLLEDFKPIIEENNEVFKIIDWVVKEFGRKSANFLKNYIYTSFSIGDIRLKDVDQGVDLIMPKKEEKIRITIPDDWLETLEIYLDRELYESLSRAIESARTKPSLKYEVLE